MKSRTKMFVFILHWIVAIKDSKYAKISSVNPLYLIFFNVNEYFEQINKNKYLKLVPILKAKKQKYEELWSKIRDLIRSITKNLDDYDEKYMKIKFDSVTFKWNNRNS